MTSESDAVVGCCSGKGSKQGACGPRLGLQIATGCPLGGLSFPICRVHGSAKLTSKVLSKLEMWLCFRSPASHSEMWNNLDGSRWPVLGGILIGALL